MSGVSWGVHSMPQMGMDGRNFLAWHRHFLLRLEKRLQTVSPAVTIPYWDWIANPDIPPPINEGPLLQSWSVTRHWNPAILPPAPEVASANQPNTFDPFQARLEQVHNNVHRAVGGTMNSSSSPADPLFWLHHANIDRLWSIWQAKPGNGTPANL